MVLYTANTNRPEAASSANKAPWATSDSWVARLVVLSAGDIIRGYCPTEATVEVFFNPYPGSPKTKSDAC